MYVIAIPNRITRKYQFITFSNKLVDYVEKDAIMSYYTANKIYSEIKKTAFKESLMINLLDILLDHNKLVDGLINEKFPIGD